jgi:RecB family endonuclease NucS
MALFRLSANTLDRVATTTFAAEALRERDDLQRLIKQHIDVLGDDLLIVAEEYALFEDARRRVDLLAVDRTGTLAVIELKRTEDGGHMELQALR